MFNTPRRSHIICFGIVVYIRHSRYPKSIRFSGSSRTSLFSKHERLQGKLDDIGASEIRYPRQSSYNLKQSHPIKDYAQKVAKTFSYKYGYLVNDVKFDDAPKIVYGIAFRVRRFYDCNEEGQECGKLETEGKVVQCDVSRFR